MADKKLNEVTKVTDMAYVPVIMADGSIGQIAKADLASVVAGLIGFGNSKVLFYSEYNPNLDNIKDNARGFINEFYSGENPITDSSGWAFFESKKFPNGNTQQILTGWFIPNIRYIRHFQNNKWTSWMPF